MASDENNANSTRNNLISINVIPQKSPLLAQLNECAICLEELGLLVKKLPCKHTFHWKCISQWKSRNNSCPVCRLELRRPCCPPNRTTILLLLILFRQKPQKRKQSKNKKKDRQPKDPLAPLQRKNKVPQWSAQGRPRRGWAWKFSPPLFEQSQKISAP
uniref:RING-type domain-containing protein n=1 Tax=Strigamia maritima TaxID=126957 RepID=T1J999_STRMM